MARTYDEHVTPYHAPIARRLLELAHVEEGDRILDIEDSVALFHMRELEQASSDRCVIWRHVFVVRAGHTAVLLDQESRSLLSVQRRCGCPRIYIALSPTSPPHPLLWSRAMNLRGPHDSDVPPPSGVDPERLDGLSTCVAGERPRVVRSPLEQVEAALERRELLRPHRPEHLGAPLDPRGDGTGHRGAETRTFFGRGRFQLPCGFVKRPSPT